MNCFSTDHGEKQTPVKTGKERAIPVSGLSCLSRLLHLARDTVEPKPYHSVLASLFSEEQAEAVSLTPAMVSAEFPLIQPAQPPDRKDRLVLDIHSLTFHYISSEICFFL